MTQTTRADRDVHIRQVTSGDDEHVDRFPALWRRDGSLLLIYQFISGRNRFKGSGCHVLLASTDEGQTWREEQRAFPWSRDEEDASAAHAARRVAGVLWPGPRRRDDHPQPR